MSTTLAATIRDYNTAADTCTVELNGGGAIDTWMDGVKIASAIDRHWVAPGALCTLSMPDLHRICEAQVIQVNPPTNTGTYVPVQNPQSGVQRIQQGIVHQQCDATGHVTITVTFPIAFAAAPSVRWIGPAGSSWTISAITTTGFTATLAAPLTAYYWVFAMWYAVGNQ